MNSPSSKNAIVDECVVTLNYVLYVHGKEIENTEKKHIHFIQGRGNLIPGLERSLYGMLPGDKKRVRIDANEGYGSVDPGSIMQIPRSEFPVDMKLEPGMELEFKNPKNDTWIAVVSRIDDKNVILDFNHPLAGSELEFEIEIVAVRPATPQELSHGHAHC